MERRIFFKAGAAGMAALAASARQAPAAMRGADFYLTRLSYESGDWNVDARMPGAVLRALAETSTMRVDPLERVVALGDAAMLEAPFCYLAGHKLVQFTPAERRNFERHVRGGGFVLADDCNHDIDGLFARSFELEMARIFGPKALRRLPANHPLYSAFFRFDGPPAASVERDGRGDGQVHDYLRGIELGGRVRVLYSNKDYGCAWERAASSRRTDDANALRFAANIIHYALGA